MSTVCRQYSARSVISAIALSCHARFPESQTFWKFVENDIRSLYCGNYFKSDVNIFETGSNMQICPRPNQCPI